MPNPIPFADLIKNAAQKYNVPSVVLAALIKQESNFDPEAVGDGGLAVGLGQMHPQAAIEVGLDPKDRTDPPKAIDAVAHYLAKMYEIIPLWSWAVGAYNQGPGVIHKAFKYQSSVMNQAAEYSREQVL